jgi:sialic acid synthase SpsE
MMQLIAETAFHHEGDVRFLKGLVRAALGANADMVKIHMLLDLDEYMSRGHDIYPLLKKWLISRRDWKGILSHIKKGNTPFIGLANCTSSVEFLIREQAFGIELHSVCLCDPALLGAVREFDGKIFLGIGGSTLDEVDYAVNCLHDKRLVLMTGFQNFPTKIENLNFRKTRKLMSLFPHCEFGYADHTAWNHPLNQDITLWGAALGMDYIEKHITTQQGVERTDYSAAIGAGKFSKLKKKLAVLDKVLGSGELGLNPAEKSYSKYGPMKKAAQAVKDIRVGQRLSTSNVVFVRTDQITDLPQGEAAALVVSGAKVFKKLKSGEVLFRRHVTQ